MSNILSTAWSIVWNNEPLQYLIIIVFGFALFFEIRSVYHYQNRDLKGLADTLEFLKKNLGSSP
jgi:hypothetical protein